MGNSRRCPRPVLATNMCFRIASDSCLKRAVPALTFSAITRLTNKPPKPPTKTTNILGVPRESGVFLWRIGIPLGETPSATLQDIRSGVRRPHPPAFQSRDWRPGLAAGTADETEWKGFRDAALGDEASGAWLH
jgi:hypothetical protein